MEELSSVIGNVARLVAMVAGGLSTLAFCYAGILWMMSSGDPQKTGQARLALIGALGGLVIVGIAFIVPRVISQAVIEPVGGVAISSDVGLNCDGVLRSQMIFQRGASTATNMAVVIRQIQAQRQECPPDVWDPTVIDMPATASAEMCWNYAAAAATGVASTDGANGKVGASQVPRGLRVGNADTGNVRALSGRDSDNNIIVYWSSTNRPSDGAKCWLFVSRLRTWSENY